MHRILASLLVLTACLHAQTRLLRFPDLHGDRVVFCHGGDLWSVAASGGTAVRLTAHPGLELFPRFSPDGAWIAFTGQYDGDEQVHVMPAGGGEPRRLTCYPARGPLPARWGYDNQVYGWTPDGRAVLFRSMRQAFGLTDTRLYTVPLDGGPPEPLPMPVSGGGDLSPDGKRAVYSPLTRDFRTWKRYEGGWAQDLYVIDLETLALVPIAHSPRTERDPMWIGDSIVFASDRTGTLNLYRHSLATGTTEALTSSREWDVRWPSKAEDERVVYELGGELRILDLRTGEDRGLPVLVPDDGLHTRPRRVATGGQLEGFDLAPKGERALVVARGDVHTLPVEKGAPRALTATSTAHERLAQWSPSGALVAYVSDASGEEEIHVTAQDGSGPARRLTEGLGLRITRLAWSPDSTRIAFSDAAGRLRVVAVADGSIAGIAQDPSGRLRDFQWSPDGRWLAFSMGEATGFRSIWIHGGEEARLERVTPLLSSEWSPAWDPAGRYLWFLADRDYAPVLGQREWNVLPARMTGIFALALRRDVPHPFPPESDEVDTAVKAGSGREAGGGEEAPAEPHGPAEAGKPEEKPASAPIAIDFDGIEQRVARVPVEADHLSILAAAPGHLLFVRSGIRHYGRPSDRKSELQAFDLKKRETRTLVSGLEGGYALSADGKKVLARTGQGLELLDVGGDGKGKARTVATGGLHAVIDPREEWATIFGEVWRRFRDFFYVPNLHGYDWEALRDRYAALLPHVRHRSDLNYVLGEMVAELNVSHAYVSGGDWVAPARRRVALLGAEIVLDRELGRYRIARILPGQNEEEDYRSPLTEIGVDVAVGEFLFSVDGRELRPDRDPYEAFLDLGEHPLEIRVGQDPDQARARAVKVRPVASETNLRYLDFVLRNRARVEELSGGRLGYLHIPDMGEEGIREFIKWYYGQVRCDGLVVDVRNNGGGNVSQMILERLRRTLLATGYSRHDAFTSTYPSVVFTGPMVCLLNENSASDGDIFPWMFRAAGLGPLIGKRSWGGVVGITDHGPLLDGGTVNVPEFGHADALGRWAVEGHGVDPDIVVENDPASLIQGRDPQLERAVEVLLEALPGRPAALPPRPPDPVK
jgi:tricorn protease